MAPRAGAGQANGAHVSGTFVTGEVVAQRKPNGKANCDEAASSSDMGKENLKGGTANSGTVPILFTKA